SEEAHQLGRVERDGGKDQNGFGALAQHHQENEDEQAEPGVVAGQQTDFAFDLSLELAPRFHHEDDHGEDEEGGNQHDPAFKDMTPPPRQSICYFTMESDRDHTA